MDLNVEDENIQLSFERINYGSGVKDEVKLIKSKMIGEGVLKTFKKAYTTLAKYLLQNLPLNNKMLISLKALNPAYKKQPEWTKAAIEILMSKMNGHFDKKRVFIFAI